MQTLLRDTSHGRVSLRFWNVRASGVSVTLGLADDSGWIGEDVTWNTREEDRTLTDAILELVPISRDEADLLARDAMEEWKGRGGEEEGRGDTVKGLALVTAIGTGVLFTFVIVVAIVAVLVWGLFSS